MGSAPTIQTINNDGNQQLNDVTNDDDLRNVRLPEVYYKTHGQ